MHLLDKAIELRGSQVLNIHTYHTIIWQRRTMAAATFLAWLSVPLFIIALSTTHWATLEFQNMDLHNVSVDLGVWGEWRNVTMFNGSTIEWIPHFPYPPAHVLRLADTDLNHYYRAQAAIGVIALFILLSTNILAVYTFYHHRYMFKRLCSMLYLVTALAIWATIEVLTNSVDEWNVSVASASQNGEWDYEQVLAIGYSTRLAQAVIVCCAFGVFAFFWGSHMQKGDQAATSDLEIEDRPVHIGRL